MTQLVDGMIAEGAEFGFGIDASDRRGTGERGLSRRELVGLEFAIGVRVRLANIWNWPSGQVISCDPARVHVRWDNGLQEITTADQLCLERL